MIGIISGTGLYSSLNLEDEKSKSVSTPYGMPSSKIKIGYFKGKKVAFLARHGYKHSIPPHKINHRANIWALKKLGVKKIISTAAVGSLKKNYRPGDIVLPDQLIDFGKDVLTFYDGGDKGVYHVSLADPFCPYLRKLMIHATRKLGIRFHESGTYLRISGPRFSTRAESNMFRKFADIIGMTVAGEAVLSREKEMCYATVATVTDYDVWAPRPVSAEEVKSIMRKNAEKVEKIIKRLIVDVDPKKDCICMHALENAAI